MNLMVVCWTSYAYYLEAVLPQAQNSCPGIAGLSGPTMSFPCVAGVSFNMPLLPWI
jgi:hypothetical protein